MQLQRHDVPRSRCERWSSSWKIKPSHDGSKAFSITTRIGFAIGALRTNFLSQMSPSWQRWKRWASGRNRGEHVITKLSRRCCFQEAVRQRSGGKGIQLSPEEVGTADG